MNTVQNTDSIDEQAARWIAREDGADWSAAEAGVRDAWLAESALHRVSYLRLKSAWDRADRLAALRPAQMPERRPIRESAPWLRIAAGFALFVLLGSGAAYYLWPQGGAYATPVGARETVHLADGSVMELNTNTHVRATVDDTTRKIVLEQGEVFLQVVHDAKRPFTVLAGNRRITDLGTKFSVQRIGDQVKVVVTEGRVRIENLDQPAVAHPLEATRDTQVVANADSTLIVPRTPQQVTNALGWRNGLLIFSQDTLADAAAEFNRYNGKKLVIDGNAVARTRIGGSFEATNVEAFARLLHDGFGLRVEETDSEVRISE